MSSDFWRFSAGGEWGGGTRQDSQDGQHRRQKPLQRTPYILLILFKSEIETRIRPESFIEPQGRGDAEEEHGDSEK